MDSSAILIEQLQADEPAAAEAVVARYHRRLRALAARRLSPRLARRVDADDVLQSAYRSFFRRARAGEFAVQRSGDLWRLLSAIVVRKACSQAQRHRASRRSIEREATTQPDTTHARDDPVSNVAAAETLEQLLEPLSAEQRQAIAMRLDNHTLDEIADRLGRSERTVRRWIESLRRDWGSRTER